MEPVDHLSVPRNHDLVTIVPRDHATLSSMLGAAVDAGPADGSDRFGAAVHELARHDGAEDRVVPGAVRATGQGAVHSALLDHWQRQQDGLEHALHELERLRGAASFAPALGRFADLVAEHAAWEEAELLPVLAAGLTDAERLDWGDRYAEAKRTAPTHPHPRLRPRSPVGRMAGLVVAGTDRIRDRLRIDPPAANRSAPTHPDR